VVFDSLGSKSRMRELTGSVAVVSGASLGIGAAVARALAREGCDVALLARGRDALDRLANEIAAAGGSAHPYPCDMSDSEAVAETLAAVAGERGPVSILVNNVGAGTFKPLDQMSLRDAMLAVQLPYGAAIAACHTVVPSMKERRRGHIVNLTSPAGYFPLPYMVPYTASRHAMVGLSQSLREELSEHDIGVSLICPAQVNTGYFERNDADMGWYPRISRMFPVLEPEQVADEVVRSIRENRAEYIFPRRLRILAAAWRRAPNTSLWLTKRLGLFQPSKRP
jgi:short-subunit dehydrogenase